MTAPEFTDAQIVEGITAALIKGRIDLIEGLLRLLLVQNQDEAIRVYDALQLGALLAQEAS